MFLKNSILIILFFIISCQPVEIISTPEIDNDKLKTILINAKEVTIINKYNPIFSDKNIEDQVTNPPIMVLKNWLNENIKIFGNQNKLIINILDSSIYKTEIENVNAKNYEEKTIFLYEIFYLVEYELYDDSNYLLANSTVEVSRSTTSQKYISLNQLDLIINDLLVKSLRDFVNETQRMLTLYMNEFVQ